LFEAQKKLGYIGCNVAKQQAFIESHDKLLNSLGNDEAVRLWTRCI
jgi:hypothetical protein